VLVELAGALADLAGSYLTLHVRGWTLRNKSASVKTVYGFGDRRLATAPLVILLASAVAIP
jgi:hypothetical protein